MSVLQRAIMPAALYEIPAIVFVIYNPDYSENTINLLRKSMSESHNIMVRFNNKVKIDWVSELSGSE